MIVIKNLQELITQATKANPLKMSVACAHDLEVLSAVNQAKKLGIIEPILVGIKSKIIDIINENNFDLNDVQILDYATDQEACQKAVQLVSSQEASFVMKGIVDTSVILKEVLNRDYGLRTGNVLSHVAVLEIPNQERLYYLTDGAMNMYPELEQKKQIVENAVTVAHALGNEVPNVGILAAIEKVNPKMQATVDAAALEEMNISGAIKGCKVAGPFALDNAVSKEAAHHKGIHHPLAGDVDILVVPNIEAGNVLYKALIYLAGAKTAGIISGAQAPVVLTSRADSDECKLYSIALGAMVAMNREK